MADHNEALRLADAIDPFTRTKCPDHLTSKVAADALRQQAERITELEKEALAKPFAPDWAGYRQGLEDGKREGQAERDQLRAEVESLRSAVNAFCDATSWSAQSWKDQPYIKQLFDLARTTHKDEG